METICQTVINDRIMKEMMVAICSVIDDTNMGFLEAFELRVGVFLNHTSFFF